MHFSVLSPGPTWTDQDWFTDHCAGYVICPATSEWQITWQGDSFRASSWSLFLSFVYFCSMYLYVLYFSVCIPLYNVEIPPQARCKNWDVICHRSMLSATANQGVTSILTSQWASSTHQRSTSSFLRLLVSHCSNFFWFPCSKLFHLSICFLLSSPEQLMPEPHIITSEDTLHMMHSCHSNCERQAIPFISSNVTPSLATLEDNDAGDEQGNVLSTVMAHFRKYTLSRTLTTRSIAHMHSTTQVHSLALTIHNSTSQHMSPAKTKGYSTHQPQYPQDRCHLQYHLRNTLQRSIKLPWWPTRASLSLQNLLEGFRIIGNAPACYDFKRLGQSSTVKVQEFGLAEPRRVQVATLVLSY